MCNKPAPAYHEDVRDMRGHEGMETRRRTLVKAGIWTALGWAVMALVGLAVTGSAAAGGTMATVNAVLGAVSYVVYERVWSGIHWGRAA